MCLKALYKKIHNKDLKIIKYGKPYKPTYDFTEKFIKDQTKHAISNFYMIGDNPKSDIKGANAQGWISILVR